MTRKDIQLILLAVIAAALVVIAIQLLFPPRPKAPAYEAQDVAQVDWSTYTYVASANSEVFHEPSCQWAQKISERNLTGFKSRQEAVNSGRRPCKVCKP